MGGGWRIEYWNGSNWVQLLSRIEKIPQELDGHEEASFIIENSLTNRTIVSQDRKVRITFEETVIFKGIMSAIDYGDDTILCIVYTEAYEKMKAKDFTAEYSATSADTILQAICTAAGVVKGSCPVTTVSVRFKRTLCFDAATFLADALNKDFWGDYDGSDNPRFNIGDRGSAKGDVTPFSWPRRGLDRSKKRDKVIIRGVDADGDYIEGSAGTGTNVAVLSEKKATDITTLNNLAAKKLAELNKESSGVALPVSIAVAYNLYPGDTVTLYKASLELVGDFRIWKITKYVDKADVEVDRPQDVTDKRLQETKQYEDLGIYQIPAEQIPDRYFDKTIDDILDVTDVAPSVPAFTAVAEEVDTTTEFRTWIKVTITRVNDAGGYIVGYKKNSDATYTEMWVDQPASGDPMVATPDLEGNTLYNVRVASVSQKGKASAWSTPSNVTSSANNTAPATPSGLTATALLNAVLIEWQHVGAKDLAHYQVFRSITSNPADAVSIGTTRGNILLWKVYTPAAEYIVHYFWVTAIDNANNESAKQGTPVSATPLRIKPIDLQVESRPWTADFKTWEDLTTYGKLYWSAKDGASDGTVKFADGSTRTITKNLTGTSFAAGIRYFYWDTVDNTLKNTTDYGAAVGEGKGLIEVVDVRTDKPSTILPIDSYLPTIGAGFIAAKAIRSEHLVTDQAVITQSLQVAGCLVDANVVQLSASKILIDGPVYLSSWRKAGDLTKIDGGVISTGTILADSIAAGQILILKLAKETLDRMYDSATLSDAIQGWPHALDVTKIDGGDIYTGSVHTAQILFDILASDPAYVAGKLWCRTIDNDVQLRFSKGTTLADVFIIPKYPLYDVQAPPENMIPNQSFEFDRDADGIPDSWVAQTWYGSPSFGISTIQSYKGKNCVSIGLGAAGEGWFLSEYIPVVPGKKYFVSGMVKTAAGEGGSLGWTPIFIRWYYRDKTTPVDTNVADTAVTENWQQKSAEVTVPAGKYWARVILRHVYNSMRTLFFDDIVLSEMRAAVPTAGAVAAASATYGNETSVPDMTWTTLFSWTVSDVDMEEYDICAAVQVRSSPGTDFWLRVRIYDSTDGIYYPINDSANVHQIPMIFPNLAYSAGNCFFTIPKDVGGHTLYLQVLHSIGSAKLFMARYAGWGHSPHSHR